MADKKTNDTITSTGVRDFSNKSSEYILKRVRDDKEMSDSFQTNFFDKFRTWYKLYKRHIDGVTGNEYVSEDRDGTPQDAIRSQLFIPKIYSLIAVLIPKIALSMFKSKPYMTAVAVDAPSDTREDISKRFTRFITYQFNKYIKIIPFSIRVLKNTAVYGTAFTKQTWEYKVKKKKKKVATKGLGKLIKGKYTTVEQTTVIKDNPKAVIIPILNFFFDPVATTIEDARYVIHEYPKDLSSLLMDVENAPKGTYMNIDILKATYSHESSDNDIENIMEETGISLSSTQKKGLKIWEHWTDDWVTMVVNDKIVIQSRENPFDHKKKPFTRWVLDEMAGEMYGQSMVDLLEHLQVELNTTRNQRIDNVSLAINKMYKIRRGADINPDDLISRPAGFIEVDEMDDVKELEMTTVDGSAYTEEEYIKRDMDDAIGVYDPQRGSSGSRRETATTMSILDRAGSQRFEMMVLVAEINGFEDMSQQIIELDQQFVNEKAIFFMSDDDSGQDKMQQQEVAPEEMIFKYEIMSAGSSVDPYANSEMKITNLLQMLGYTQSMPTVDSAAIVRAVLEEYNMQGIDRFFREPQQAIEGAGTNPEALNGLQNAAAMGQMGGAQQ